MKIRIIQIGKNKDKYIDDATNEFLKRLRGFANVEILTLKERAVSKTFTKERAIEEEGIEILRRIGIDSRLRWNDRNGGNDSAFIIALDEKGSEYSSVGFSKFLQKFKDSGTEITFIIGGPYGLSESVKNSANTVLSFSKMTFTHQFIRILLLEQIYRGFCIINKKEYHNE